MASSIGYDFSQIYHSSTLAFSPGTTFLASSHHNRLIVRSSATLAIVRTWLCRAACSPPASSSSSLTSRKSDLKEGFEIDTLLWSADSLYLLAFSSEAQTAWVFGLAEDGSGDSGEIARIGGEGIEGLVRVEWSRTGRDVLAWSDFGLRLSIFSLSTGSAGVIQYPKSPTGCHTYSPNGRYLAVAERHSGKDHIGVYDTTAQYQLVRSFPLQTNDVQGISWSPCGKWIAAVDSHLSFSMYIHSPIGPLLSHFSFTSPGFSPTATSTSSSTSTSSTEDPGLGIRTTAWAPGGRFIAVGGWDGKVRVLESDGWRCVAVMTWGTRTVEKNATVWREPTDWLRDTRGRGIVQFDRLPVPCVLPTTRADFTNATPRAGILQVAFDNDATLLLIRLETSPHVIHIHTFLPTPNAASPMITHLTSLIFTYPVKTAKWSPSGARRLAVTTRSGAVYFWDAEGAWVDDGAEDARGGMMEGVGVPSRVEFAAHDVQWAPDGTSLAVRDKSQFCILYETEDDQDGPSRWDGVEGLTHVSEEDEEVDESFAGFNMPVLAA